MDSFADNDDHNGDDDDKDDKTWDEDGKDEDGKDENLVVAIETSGEGRATDEGKEGETAPSCHHH